jgi:Rieske Fe-S protein
MNDPRLNRRSFLKGSGLTLGALLALPTVAAHAAGTRVAISLSKLEMLKTVGGAVVVKAKGKLLLLVRDTATTVRAFNPTCTHRQCIVAYKAADHEIKCPCHGSRYDLEGRVVHGPAPRALETYAATLEGEQIIVTL